MTATRPASESASRRERVLPAAAVLLTLTLWASAFVGIRSAGREFEPGPLALLRLLVGTAALGVLLLLRREGLPPRRTLPGIAVVGVLWFAAYNVALNDAERRVDAGTAAMLVNVGPVLIAVLAALLLGEGLPRRLLGGCLVAFSGVAVIALATSRHGPTPIWGAVLCIAAAGAYSVGVVAQKPVLARASPLQTTWLACLIGTVVCLPFAASLVHELGAARPSAIGWAFYLGAAPTAIGFAAWAYALSRTTAGRLGATTYLVPPIAILLSWGLLDETPPAVALAGGAVCLLGVAITRGRQRARNPEPARRAEPAVAESGGE